MAKAKPLNLAAVDPAIWRVFVGNTPYGPYTLGQLQGFVEEGRVTAASLISKGDGGELIRAESIRELHKAFSERAPSAEVPSDALAQHQSNYFISAALKRTSDVDLMVCLNRLGKFAAVLPGTYVLNSPFRLRDVQAALNEAVTLDDQVIIVNASSGRLAWLNVGTDTDIHLRDIWVTEETQDTADEAVD